ncbi:MAG: MmcQ/YjbR family DNA-binding protein [Rhodothermales bacterium]|nr:MmcQ/YjbR family DNA-binding protein [Rhodothermales bacterium]
MSTSREDPTEPMRLTASRYPDVDEGTACTQSSFKAAGKAFLYVGMQGGRYKAMFKLQKSMPDARKLAEKQPDRYEVGSTGWVTARFSAEKPMPTRRWETWLDESYNLCVSTGPVRKSRRKKSAKTQSKGAGMSPKRSPRK